MRVADLPTLLHTATGQPWTWSPALWGYVSADGRYLLADRDDGAWQLRALPGDAHLSPWWAPKPGEPTPVNEARVATEVAALIRSTAGQPAQPPEGASRETA